jgi:hypothetical protein
LRQSAVELVGFATLFLLAFLVTGSWFFLGGAARCLLTGASHGRWAWKAQGAKEQGIE